MTVQDFLDDFHDTLLGAFTRLMEISEEDASVAPSPAKWSPKEVIGHLIDSAANNHSRFVRAQASDELVFQGYDQDAWVRLQRYNELPWTELIGLWLAYNRHISRVICYISPESLSLPRSVHNLDEIAWRTVPRDQPVTLEYFIRDYLAHMKHHLAQIK